MYQKAYEYDPLHPGWEPLPDLPGPRAFHTAFALQGKIYLLGGWDNTHTLLSRVDVYDPQTNAWSNAAPIPNGYLGSGAVAIDGQLHVLGGSEAGTDVFGGVLYWPVNNHYRYDPAQNTWTSLANLFNWQGFWNCLSRSSVIYCAGGYESSHPGYMGSLAASLWSYDLANNSSTTLKNMLARHGQATSAATLGRLYMTGGALSHAVGVLVDSSAGEFYEPELDRWVQIPGIGDVRGAAGACGLMAIGGQSSAGVYYNKTWRLAGEGYCEPAVIPWLSVDQFSLALSPDETKTLRLTLDSHGLTTGVYTAHLTIFTDSPYAATDLPITLTVGTQPNQVFIHLPIVRKK